MLRGALRPIVCAVICAVIFAGQQVSDGNSRAGDSRSDRRSPIPVERQGKWGYADNVGNIVIPAQFSLAHRFSDGLALVWFGGIPLTDPIVKDFVKMGYIDRTGRWAFASNFKYYFYDDFSEGLVPFRQQFGKWGYMDRTGRIVIKPRFNWAGDFSNGAAPVLTDTNRCANTDRAGKITGRSDSEISRLKFERNRKGTFLSKPVVSPCS